ncbi:MAG: PQQ-dependent sugar dehydrogenase, partial [Actinomycetes bacterium]
LVLASGLAATATPASGGAPTEGGARAASHPPLGSIAVTWRRVTGGLVQPTQVTSAPDGRKRLFVVEKAGRIRLVRDGAVSPKPYLGMAPRIDPAGEGGLLSVAFSPQFRRDGLLFVAYTRAADHDLVVARLKARSAGAKHVRATKLRPILRIEHSAQTNHFGGQLAFGPDGRLYIGTGDGGGAGDPGKNAGDRRDLRGKILRINPFHSCGGKRYCIPKGNPLVGKKVRGEIWLMGLRNPWRFSFDRRTDHLWIGDVGQEAYEEIDQIGPHPGRINLGWSCKEGRSTYNASRCRSAVKYIGPETVVPHPAAESITGGFVYRGHRYRSQLGGAYVFADFITQRVWLYRSGPGRVLQSRRLSGGPTSFGVDDRGEIYAVTYDGSLWRMRVTRR